MSEYAAMMAGIMTDVIADMDAKEVGCQVTRRDRVVIDKFTT